MLNQIFIGTVLSAITAGAAYRHHQWRKYHIIDNHKEIDKKYAGSDILSISAKQATSIGGDAFRSCSSLEKANFPKLVSIGEGAFRSCTSLEVANFPEASSIGGYGFKDCTSLEEANFPEATSIGDRGFRECKSLRVVYFPKADSIGFYGFKDCTSLEEANFPELTSIGDYGFEGCTSLEKANFPELTSIGDIAFAVCTSLKEANFPKATSIGSGAFRSCRSLEEANCPKANSIGDRAFMYCRLLKEANFPKATSIGDYGFQYCTSLKKACFPEVTSVGRGGFSLCTSLKVAYFPKTTSIDLSAFRRCDNLQTIILPDSLFDNNVVTDEWKAQRGIRADAQCIRHSDYLKSIIEVNSLIGQERFREGDDKILELQLLQKIHDDEKALPGELSDDEKNMLMRIPESGVLKSDVYKMVKSIKGDNYERKKEWAKFLGVKVDVSEPMTENTGEAEDTKKATLIRQQLETIALEIELDKMIVKCEEPIHEYLLLEEMISLEEPSIGGDIGLPIQFNSERTEREKTLNEYKKQLDAYIQNPGSIKEELKSIAEHVEELFKEVTQLDNESPKFKA